MQTEKNSKIIEKLRLEGTFGDQLIQPSAQSSGNYIKIPSPDYAQ